MSKASLIDDRSFDASALKRLEGFLSENGQDNSQITVLTPDASTREYFRIKWKTSSAIACVYPERIDRENHSYLDVTRLFLSANLPVPEIYELVDDKGIIIQEDLGDTSLWDLLENTTLDEVRDEYQSEAISLIARIQSVTDKAIEVNSISSRFAFDFEKLSWEAGFFKDHYFSSLRKEDTSAAEFVELKAELDDVCNELSARPRVLCHRDYHAMNLMVDKNGRIRIIDYQDARMGPSSYDLVSLVLDRQLEVPSLANLRSCRLLLLDERRKLGLSPIDPDEFANEFRLMTIQRCLKAVGTFSFQTAVRGRGEKYSMYIDYMLKIVHQATVMLGRFPALQEMIKRRLAES